MIRKALRRLLELMGISWVTFWDNLTGLPFYYCDWREFKKQRGDDTTFRLGTPYPVLDERNSESATVSRLYFYQDLHVARLIFKNLPNRHVDIGSRIDGFVAHVAVFRPIEVLDVRPQSMVVENVVFKQADLMVLPDDMLNYCDSISSLNAIEHFGLGRYGDPIDYFGYLKAIRNITKILQKGGVFYFSVPIGRQRVEFNAHRVFAVAYLLNLFEADYRVRSFSCIDDAGNFHQDVSIDPASVETNYGCRFGCGIFELVKK